MYKTRFKYKKRLYVKFNEDFRGLYLSTPNFRIQLRNYYYFFFYRRFIFKNINFMKQYLAPKYGTNYARLILRYKPQLGYRHASSLSLIFTTKNFLTKFTNYRSTPVFTLRRCAVRLKKFATENNIRFWKFYAKYWNKRFFIRKHKPKRFNFRYKYVRRRLRFFLWRIRKLKRTLGWSKFCISLWNDTELLKSVLRRAKRPKVDKYTKYLNYLFRKFGGPSTQKKEKNIWQPMERKIKTNNLLSLRPKLLLPGFKRNNFQKKRIRFFGINSYKGRFFRLVQLQMSLGLVKLPFLRKYVKLYNNNLQKTNRFASLLSFRLFIFLYNLNLCPSIMSAFYIIRLFGFNINFNWTYHPVTIVQPNDIFFLPLVLRYYLRRTFNWKKRRILKFFFKNLPYKLLFNFRSGSFLFQFSELNYSTVKFGKKFYKLRFNGFGGKERKFDSINSNTYMHAIKYFNRR